MAKYKVGDKVRVRSWDSMMKEYGPYGWYGIKVPGSYFTEEMKCYCGKIVTISKVNEHNNYHIKEDNKEDWKAWSFNDNMFEDVESTIVIYRKDNEVLAVDKGTGETGKAVCAPEDEFDFKIGADLAYDRLMGRKPPFRKRKEKNEFNTEVVCISIGNCTVYKFTVGKIYNIKNGILKDNVGKKITCSSVQNLNDHFLYTKFLEVVK